MKRILAADLFCGAGGASKSYVFRGSREDVVKQIGNSWTGELAFRLNVAAIEDFAPARKRTLRATA